MSLVCIRGATTCINTKEDIIEKTETLLNTIIDKNNIDISNISNILFTATKDLDAAYPAVASRNMGIVNAALICIQEMYVVGSLGSCIRVMVSANINATQKDVIHIYLEKATVLRPDLALK